MELRKLWAPAIDNRLRGIADRGTAENQALADNLKDEINDRITRAIKKNPHLANPAASSWLIATRVPAEGALKEDSSFGSFSPCIAKIGCESVGGVSIDLPAEQVKIRYPYVMKDERGIYPHAFTTSTVMEIHFPDGTKTIALHEKNAMSPLEKIDFVGKEAIRAYGLSQLDNVLAEYLGIIEKVGQG